MTGFTGRYVFVAGLHRTGTSLVTKLIAAHSSIAAINGSPAPEDEGCYLQGAIPHTALHGIPGEYATDPTQHCIESSALNSFETKRRMEADWAPWFDPVKSWRVEKSPVNLIRMRLYQQLFPTSQYVIIVRHPEAMAAALGKWSELSANELIDYALDAYDLVMQDIPYLHAAYLLRYEDFVEHPQRMLSSLYAYLGLELEQQEFDIRNGNADYPNAVQMSDEQARRAARFGYGRGLSASTMEPVLKHPLRSVREAILQPA